MKKKKSKMLRNLLFFVIFAGISVIAFNYFNVYDKILEYTMENGINIGNIYVVKPKVKIIDEDSKTRPIAVSINNNHDAYPHAGLQDGSIMKGWMKRENEMITCCSDGTRPVIFKIERIDYEE